MKKTALLFLILVWTASSWGQSLIISEINYSAPARNYFELYNASDQDIDLSEYMLWIAYHNWSWRTNVQEKMNLSGTLGPKQTWLFCSSFYDGDDSLNVIDGLWAKKDSAIRYRASGIPGSDLIRSFDGTGALGIWWKLPQDSIQVLYAGTDSAKNDTVFFQGDSILVDVFGIPAVTTAIDVAGVPGATNEHILVRKANIKKGEPDFNISRGGTPSESQWIVIPEWKGGGVDRVPHNTLKIHGHYSDFGFQSDVVVLDKENGKVSMPYGIRRDSLLRFVSMGPNTGYTYQIGPDTANSILFRTGDSLDVFVVGNELVEQRFIVEVSAPVNNHVYAFPTLEGPNYTVTRDVPGMDSILNVTYATRKDTLLKYIEIAPNANASFVWVDGKERVDLKDGDIFKVTAEDGSSKEYFISVNDYVPNENTYLQQIYVNGDTLEAFARTPYLYSVTLPMGTKSLPSVDGIPEVRSSSVKVMPPKGLIGSSKDRTAVITVTSENDTLTREYFITFNVEVETPDFKGEPFISQFIRATEVALEIYNPSSEFLDLSNYVLFNLKSGALSSYEKLFEEQLIRDNLKTYLRFGYYVDTERADGIFYLPTDKVDAFVEPGKTFNMAGNSTNWRDKTVLSRSHFIGKNGDAYGFVDGSLFGQNDWNPNHPIVLLKILNDSIIDGTKSATDPNDFEIIDLIGEIGKTANHQFGPDSITWPNSGRREMIVRLPHVYKGNPASSWSPAGDFGLEDSTTLEWDYQSYTNLGNNGKWVSFGYGEHFMNPVSVHLSTVTSIVYLVSDGYIAEQTIEGIAANSKVSDFYANIIKANEEQVFTVTSGETEKTENDIVATGDILTVVSADGNNTTKYVISVGDLSDDVSLSSSVYNVAESKIQDVPVGTTLADLLSNVTIALGARLNVFDDMGQVVPTTVLNADTLIVDVLVSSKFNIEVTAQNNVNKKSYPISLSVSDDDVWILSNYYVVKDEPMSVNAVIGGEIVSAFLARLQIPEGASIKVVDKKGFERQFGVMAIDDRVVVTSASGDKYQEYELNFSDGDNTALRIRKSDSGLKLYPNPANDYCIISGTTNISSYTLYNISGRALVTRTVGTKDVRIDLNDYSKGIYLISVKDSNNTNTTLKVIKR